MNLRAKKLLAAKTLGAGKGRIIFNIQRLEEVNEAMTKQDIRDLFASGAIMIKGIHGTRKVLTRKTRRRVGSIKKKVNKGKRKYIILTRKLRNYISELLFQEKITKPQYAKLRQEIKAHAFKSKAHLKERLAQFK